GCCPGSPWPCTVATPRSPTPPASTRRCSTRWCCSQPARGSSTRSRAAGMPCSSSSETWTRPVAVACSGWGSPPKPRPRCRSCTRAISCSAGRSTAGCGPSAAVAHRPVAGHALGLVGPAAEAHVQALAVSARVPHQAAVGRPSTRPLDHPPPRLLLDPQRGRRLVERLLQLVVQEDDLDLARVGQRRHQLPQRLVVHAPGLDREPRRV